MDDTGNGAIRLLVAHRYALFREGIRTALARLPGAEIVGEAEDGATAMALATSAAPDVVLCGAGLADMTGLELTRRLRLRAPNAGIILMAERELEDAMYQALKAGAQGFALETASPEELRELVRRVASGEHTLDESLLNRPEMATKVLREFESIGEDTPHELQPLLAPLSPREIEILDQISRGNSNKQIARNLSISDQTVKNHITSILKKLAVNDRTEAVVFSLREAGLASTIECL
jgi:DNA-binding NarL/FixJ family response regulator